ncbi:Rhodanese-related sulfurtransferase [Pelagirhabdus alkalitolerans]|uniref:Rhodanese-related sulfurtransferase n=1 Tax=Pelagirhabdus alkalitolerans TaxID=1612202 RepID=A0A1G6KLP5_9BACI|nr:rhodanese-like domain-containing protein [Pelagirhabdus alkalitolerans]SDC31999.1 Rhodanese-related sulfurtransferase [Pelagirhabdus alkalitolerans]
MKSIDAITLNQQMSGIESFALIDVREPFEYYEGHVPGAINIPLGSLPQQIAKLDKNQHYYIICLTGARSRGAVHFLDQLGFDVTNVEGGMMLWPSSKVK